VAVTRLALAGRRRKAAGRIFNSALTHAALKAEAIDGQALARSIQSTITLAQGPVR